jgi:hypothetical protein
MAKRLFDSGGQTFTAQAYTTALTSSTYMCLKGGTTTQMIDCLEFLVSGMATSSTVAAMQVVRSSTIGTTPTALAAPNSDGPMVPATAPLASVPVSYVAAATGPLASNTTTDAKLNLALNLFGGIIRWNAAPTQQWQLLGNTANFGETVLFNSTTSGGSSGQANAHYIYEPY